MWTSDFKAELSRTCASQLLWGGEEIDTSSSLTQSFILAQSRTVDSWLQNAQNAQNGALSRLGRQLEIKAIAARRNQITHRS